MTIILSLFFLALILIALLDIITEHYKVYKNAVVLEKEKRDTNPWLEPKYYLRIKYKSLTRDGKTIEKNKTIKVELMIWARTEIGDNIMI